MNNYTHPIKILFADNNTLLSYGFKSILGKISNVELVGNAGTFRELINFTDIYKHDVIITDSTLPGMDGPETIRKLSVKSNSPVILFEQEINTLHFLYYINKSVHSIISKSESIQILLEAIYAVHRGEYYYCNNVLKYVNNFRIEMAGKSNAV